MKLHLIEAATSISVKPDPSGVPGTGALGKLLNGLAAIPRADTIAKLGGALGVDPCALMEGIVWRAGKIDPGNFEISPLPTTVPQRSRDAAR
jgi:transcriptional regulator with XRE-family HTH domain